MECCACAYDKDRLCDSTCVAFNHTEYQHCVSMGLACSRESPTKMYYEVKKDECKRGNFTIRFTDKVKN